MMENPYLLRIPGPSPIPPSVQQAMSKQMIGHRGSEAKVLIQKVKQKLKPIFGTEQDVMILTGSGTSGLEAAVVNTVSAGDEVLVIVTGDFGDRFARICETYQLIVHRLEVVWGQAVTSEQVTLYLQKYPKVKAVFTTFCETSTGVINPVKEISQSVHEHSEALIIVDGVSCVGGIDTRMDDWGVDILITGSQKAMMLPPGLSFIAVSDKAWTIIEKNKQPRFYLDLEKHRNSLMTNATPFTPGLSLLFGLDQVLNLLEEEGLANVYKRHLLMMRMMRAGIKALDIPLLVNNENASPTVTAIEPNDFDGELLRRQLKQEFGLDVAGGQQHLKGKLIRIGHMGYCTPADILQIISLLEVGLHQIGRKVVLGKGLAAAQEIYISGGVN